MKTIEGFVFMAECKEAEFMFGKPTSKDCAIYENMESNGLTPYDSQEEAKDAARFFASGKGSSQLFYLISLGKLWMKIAETKEEVYHFRHKTNLIVIMKDYDDISKTDKLFGPLPTKKGRTTAYPLPGAYLIFNGYIPHRNQDGQTAFESAKYQLTEINRQGGCPAVIAQFKLKWLEELFKR